MFRWLVAVMQRVAEDAHRVGVVLEQREKRQHQHALGHRHASSSRLSNYYSASSSPVGRHTNYSDNEASYNMHAPRGQHVSNYERYHSEQGYTPRGQEPRVTSARVASRERRDLSRETFERGTHRRKPSRRGE